MKSGSLNFLEPSGPHRVCYGTALPFILREEHKLKVFENRVLRKIFGLKRDEKTT